MVMKLNTKILSIVVSVLLLYSTLTFFSGCEITEKSEQYKLEWILKAQGLWIQVDTSFTMDTYLLTNNGTEWQFGPHEAFKLMYSDSVMIATDNDVLDVGSEIIVPDGLYGIEWESDTIWLWQSEEYFVQLGLVKQH